jgi:WD40 repeat protein
MKTILHFLTTIIVLFLLFIIPLQAQEEVPDTVWSKNLGNVQMVKFSPDGKNLYVGVIEIGRSLVYKINNATGLIVDTFSYLPPLIKRIDLSANGDTLMVSGSGFIWLWDVETGDTIFTLKYGDEACFTPDGKRIIATTGKMGFDEPQILVIDIETKEIIKSFIGRYYYASNPQISSDGKYLSFKDFRGTYSTIILMDLNDYEELKIFENSNGSLDQNVFSPDSKYLAANSAGDRDIFIWDLATLEMYKHIQYEENDNVLNPSVNTIKFSNNSQYLIFPFFDWEDYDPNKIIVWNIEGDSLEYEYPYSAQRAIDISKDNYIAACGQYPGYLTLLRPKWNGTYIKEQKEEDFKYSLKDVILKIKFDDELNNTPTINIYDISGKLVKSISDFELQTDFKSINVNVDFLISGVYLIEIKLRNQIYSLKVLKE